jgi:hypothetical protein
VTRPARERLGLQDLDRVVLSPDVEAQLARALEMSQGSASWRARKRAEARDLLALAEIAPRMQVLALDPSTELLALVRLRCAAPCRSPESDDIQIVREVDLAIRYPETLLTTPLPGPELVQITQPRSIFHPNVLAAPPQRLCLGVSIPVGFPLREAVVASYAALTLQSIQVDERDHAGVLNLAAALYWQANGHRIPLSNEPFLADVAQDADVAPSQLEAKP